MSSKSAKRLLSFLYRCYQKRGWVRLLWKFGEIFLHLPPAKVVQKHLREAAKALAKDAGETSKRIARIEVAKIAIACCAHPPLWLGKALFWAGLGVLTVGAMVGSLGLLGVGFAAESAQLQTVALWIMGVLWLVIGLLIMAAAWALAISPGGRMKRSPWWDELALEIARWATRRR
jgi:hypothetical protein